MMDFIKSKKMKISLSKSDQAQLSSPEKIQRALDEDQAFAFDICAGETVIGSRSFGPSANTLSSFGISLSTPPGREEAMGKLL